MSSLRLTCEETPLRWTTSVDAADLTTCNSCGFKLDAPSAGTLQVLTRRAGGRSSVGDGVNIDEANNLALDYRGQRYAYDEAVLHVPGMHIFPGQSAVYPAEYHVHFKTYSDPKRAVTVVLPVSHKIDGVGQDYFAAIAAKIDPSVTKPTLATLLAPGADVLQYQGPDIRYRTLDTAADGDQCSSTYEYQFLLVLRPCSIRAMDLERIPREGSMSTDPRDLPAPSVKPPPPLPRDRLKRTVILARPGILGDDTMADAGGSGFGSEDSKELMCSPVETVDGRNVVRVGGKEVDALKLLGASAACPSPAPAPLPPTPEMSTAERVKLFFLRIAAVLIFVAGLWIAEKVVTWLFWRAVFNHAPYLYADNLSKLMLYVSIGSAYAFNSDTLAISF